MQVKIGVRKFASRKLIVTKAISGKNASGSVSNVARPANPSAPIMMAGPRNGMKLNSMASAPHIRGSGNPSCQTARPVAVPTQRLMVANVTM